MVRLSRRMRGNGLDAVVASASRGLAWCVLALLAGCGAAPSDPVGNTTQSVGSDTLYTLGTLAHPGSCMDVQGGGTTDGTQIQEWTCNGTGAQSFALQDDGDGDGAVFLVNAQANKCVDVQGASTADATKIQLYDCNGTGAQKFAKRDAGNGLVYLVNTNSNKCLDVQADSPNNGTVVQLYACNQTNAQKWNPTVIGTGPGGGSSGGSSSGGNGSGGGGPIVTPTTKVVMYVPNWNGSYSSWATKIDFNKMTHLLLAFGTVAGNNGWDLGAQDSDVQTLAAAAHAKNVKILVSIGGAGGDSTIINAYGNQSNIAPLVANLDSMVARLNLDGVDVDLEQGTMMRSSSNYPAFVNRLMSTFHPEGKLVTSALAQYILQDANADATIMGVVNSFDFINDMIYTTNIGDYTNEPDWWTSTVHLPNDKLVWGILFGNGLSTATAEQITTDSKGYGGVMMWEYTQPTEAQLWPAIQSVL